MSDKKLYISWGILFIVCALLGFIPQPEGLIKALMVLISIIFFVPGSWLLYRAIKAKNAAGIGNIRAISMTSLCATLIFLVLNFLTANASAAAGSFLYTLLVLVSSPMICSQYWVMSLFLWACLLFTSISFRKAVQKTP